jgi:hypothetical protein
MNTQKTVAGLLLSCLALVFASNGALAEEQTEVSFDGLQPIEGAEVAMAYIDPTADFSVFKRVLILDPFVSFRSNWKRDQNRSRRRNLRAGDAERIKADAAALFRDVFIEQLETAGYEVVNEAGDDVLILRPAIIDLDVTAPESRGGGRSRTYTASNGAATLYMQLFDSVTGDIIGRAADRRVARRGGMMTWSNRVTNTADARRMFRSWADQLITFLGEQYEVKGTLQSEEPTSE